MPTISVIVPVYNAEKYIERCARSLFEQTLDDIEYIFVNDCSPDNSMQVLQHTLNEYPHRKDAVRIINHTRNTGQSGARWSGMCAATGDYIIHCDADDWVELDMYECMYRKAIETGSDAVCCDIVMEFKESTELLRYNNHFEDHQLMYDCIVPISVEYFSMCNRLISKKIFNEHKIQPFEGVNMWDDVGLAIRVRYYIQTTEVINRALYHYNRQNEVSTTRRPTLDRINEQIKCVNEIEQFFQEQKAESKYRLFLAYLKIHTKEELLLLDTKRWRHTFPETRKYYGKLSQHYTHKRLFLYYLLSYGGCAGEYILKLWKR